MRPRPLSLCMVEGGVAGACLAVPFAGIWLSVPGTAGWVIFAAGIGFGAFAGSVVLGHAFYDRPKRIDEDLAE